MVGSLAFPRFTGVLRARLLRAERGTETFTSIASAGGVATGIFALGIPAGGVVAGHGVDHIGAPEAAALNALEAVFFLGADLSAAACSQGLPLSRSARRSCRAGGPPPASCSPSGS